VQIELRNLEMNEFKNLQKNTKKTQRQTYKQKYEDYVTSNKQNVFEIKLEVLAPNSRTYRN
jgi:hypothetical protein